MAPPAVSLLISDRPGVGQPLGCAKKSACHLSVGEDVPVPLYTDTSPVSGEDGPGLLSASSACQRAATSVPVVVRQKRTPVDINSQVGQSGNVVGRSYSYLNPG